MKHQKTVTIPARKEKRVVDVSCDLCGKKGGRAGPNSMVSWSDMSTETTTIRCVLGDAIVMPEDTHIQEVHICPGCFEKKLVPWLIKKGAFITNTVWSEQ